MPMGTIQPHETGKKVFLKLTDIFEGEKKDVSGWRTTAIQLFCFCSLNKFIQVAGTEQHRQIYPFIIIFPRYMSHI